MRVKIKNGLSRLKFNRLDLFKEFTESEKSTGYILIIVTLLSIWLANSLLGNDYIKMWHGYLNLSFWEIHLNYNVEHWINDGLMVIFFLFVGLEIEREIYAGELSPVKKASLSVIAAIGGMIVPAAIQSEATPYRETVIIAEVDLNC